MSNLNVDTTEQTITAQRGHVQALAFARKGGAALSNLLGSIATAKEAERKGPIEMFLFIDQTFNEDEQHSVPVPGSKKEETGNKPYDRYTSDVQTKDGKKKVPGSWYTDVVRATDEAVAIKARIAFIDEPGDGMPEDIAAMGTGERAVERKRLNQRLADMRTALTKGAMLFLHAEEISNVNPERIKVKMPFKPLTDGTIKVTGNTIRLQDPAGEFEDKVFTVSEFLALKPESMAGTKDQWTIVALEKTKARGTKKVTGAKTAAVAKTVEELLALFNIATTSIDTQSPDGEKLHAKLIAAMAVAGEKGDDVVETVGDFCIAVDAIWTTIDKRYNLIKAKKAAALNEQVRRTAQK